MQIDGAKLAIALFCNMISLLCMSRVSCVISCFFVFYLLVVLVRLSVPVQVIDWKDSSPK